MAGSEWLSNPKLSLSMRLKFRHGLSIARNNTGWRAVKDRVQVFCTAELIRCRGARNDNKVQEAMKAGLANVSSFH